MRICCSTAACAALLFLCAQAQALSPTDKCWCEALIDDIRAETQIKFERNGSLYSSDRAASHLAAKLARSEDSLDSVDDFIVKTASHSWLTGRSYFVLLEDGSRIKASEYLTLRLKKLQEQNRTLCQ